MRNDQKFVFFSREIPGSFRAGGIATYIGDVASACAKDGKRVFIVTSKEEKDQKSVSRVDGVIVVRAGFKDYACGHSVFQRAISRLLSVLLFYVYRLNLLYIALRLEKKGAISYLEFPDYGAESLFFLFSRFRRRIVTRLHGPAFLNRTSGSFTLKPFSLFVGVHEWLCVYFAYQISSPSKYLLDMVSGFFPKLLPASISPNRISLKAVCPDFNRSSNRIKSGSGLRFIYFGSITEEKGAPQLVEFFDKTGRAPLNYSTLHLFGRCTSEFKQNWAMRKRPDESVFYCGEKSRDVLLSLLPEFDCALFPATNEPFGLVVLEALAAGLSVIANSSGAFPELQEIGLPMRIVDFSDDEALLTCLQNSILVLRENSMRERHAIDELRKFDSRFYSSDIDKRMRLLDVRANGKV